MNAPLLIAVLNRCQEDPSARARYAGAAPALASCCKSLGIVVPTWMRRAILLKSRYSYASTQLDCGESLADIIRSWTDRIVDPADLKAPSEEWSKSALEKNPHVTVRYGLHSGKPEDVAAIAARFAPVQVHFGATSIFRQPEHDVLKIDVDGRDLRRLNAALASLPHTDTYDGYQPHLTLAYLKPGTGHKYSGLRPYEHATVFDGLMVSTREGNKVKVPFQAGLPDPGPHAHALASGMEVLGNTAAEAFGKRYITETELRAYGRFYKDKIERIPVPGQPGAVYRMKGTPEERRAWARQFEQELKAELGQGPEALGKASSTYAGVTMPGVGVNRSAPSDVTSHLTSTYGTQDLTKLVMDPRPDKHVWVTPEGWITGDVGSHHTSAERAAAATGIRGGSLPEHALVHDHGMARVYLTPDFTGSGCYIDHGPNVTPAQKRTLRDIASMHTMVAASETMPNRGYGSSRLGLEREVLKKATRIAQPLSEEAAARYRKLDEEARKQPFYPWHETTEMVPTDHMLRYREVDREEQEKYPGQRAEQRASIAKEGIKEPLILIYGKADQTATLGEGNTRLANAHALGISHVPVRVVRWSGPRNGAKVPKPPTGDRTGYIPGDLKPSDLGIPTKPATEKSMRLIFKSKSRSKLPPRIAVADEDWEHPFDKMDNRAHDYHMRHHVREWQGLQSELVTTDPNDEMGRAEVVEKMRKLAGHHQGHSRMRFVLRPGKKGRK